MSVHIPNQMLSERRTATVTFANELTITFFLKLIYAALRSILQQSKRKNQSPELQSSDKFPKIFHPKCSCGAKMFYFSQYVYYIFLFSIRKKLVLYVLSRYSADTSVRLCKLSWTLRRSHPWIDQFVNNNFRYYAVNELTNAIIYVRSKYPVLLCY